MAIRYTKALMFKLLSEVNTRTVNPLTVIVKDTKYVLTYSDCENNMSIINSTEPMTTKEACLCLQAIYNTYFSLHQKAYDLGYECKQLDEQFQEVATP